MKYWNPIIETLDDEHLESLQLIRFKEIFEYAYKHSKSYNELYNEKNVNLHAIKNIEDIAKVPIVNKDFFLKKISNNNIYGGSIAVHSDDIVYYHQTSGTTNKPLSQPDTLNDWYWWAECWALMLWAQGVRKTDKVLVAFNYNLFIGFWGGHYGCEKIGTEIFSMGGSTSEQKIEKILEQGITCIITTPTYAFRLSEVAKSMDLDLKKTKVNKIICAGEPGALIPATKAAIEKIWGAKVYDHIGATEVGAWGFECNENPGGIHINEGMFLVELLDIKTNEPINEPDKYGYLVITSFYRKGRPSIRFNTQDIACWQYEKCNCGRSFRILKNGVQGRMDHLLKARGTLVTPAVIEQIVNTEELLTNEYQIVIGKENYSSLDLIVELSEKNQKHRLEKLKSDLSDSIYKVTQLKFNIILKEKGELSSNELKSKRIIDYRYGK